MPRKRGNGEGTIYNNGRYWVGQVTVGYNLDTGKIKRRSFYGRTKKEVQEKVTAAIYELNTETYIEQTNMLLEEWAVFWLNNLKKASIAETKYAR